MDKAASRIRLRLEAIEQKLDLQFNSRNYFLD